MEETHLKCNTILKGITSAANSIKHLQPQATRKAIHRKHRKTTKESFAGGTTVRDLVVAGAA